MSKPLVSLPPQTKVIDTSKIVPTRGAGILPTKESKEALDYQKLAKVQSKKLPQSSELAVRALTDMKAFAELILFHGGWKNFGECHAELADFLTMPQTSEEAQQKLKFEGDERGAYLRRLVLMPRGHLKSTIGTVLYVLWRIYRNPNIRILVGCNLQSLAYSFIRELRSYFENTKLDPIWNKRPHIPGALLPQLQKKSRDRNFSVDTEAEDRKVIWNNAALQVIRQDNVYYKEPTVFATSAGTTVTGQHYDLVILDDLIDFKNIESEVKKLAIEEWIADIESVLNPPEVCTIEGNGYVLQEVLGGEILINGTRYAIDDYYAQVLEKADVLGYQIHVRNVYKNGKDSTDGYLWHEKYNDRILESLKARLSPRRFSSQYLNTVYEKDTNLFSTQAIVILPDTSVFSHNGRLCARHPNGRTEVVAPIIALDPAFSTSKTSDDCAIIVGFKFSDGLLVVVDAYVDRMAAAEVVKNTVDLAKKYRTLRVYYEANGVGLLVPELFKSDASKVDGRQLICNGHYEQRTKESKIQGVLEMPVNIGNLALCQRVRDNEVIWKQIANFPAVRHDDFLDSLVTLYEQTIPAREVYTNKVQDIFINGIPLNAGNLPDERTQQETFLGGYGGYLY